MTPEADYFLAILRSADPHRELYRGRNGAWYITYGAGQVPLSVVHEIVRSGAVRSVYSDCPHDSYHVGQTIDCHATRELRKKPGNRHAKIYL